MCQNFGNRAFRQHRYKNVKKVFEKCKSHVKDWVNFEEKKPFPLPVLTRWGTRLKVMYTYQSTGDNYRGTWKQEAAPEKESAAAMRAVSEMGKADVKRKIRFIAVLGFLCPMIKISESSNFTAVKAMKQLDTINEKLLDLAETGNSGATALASKFFDIIEKNSGLRKISALGRGEGIDDPQEIEIFCFASCTSVEIEQFFLVLRGFLVNRPNNLDETVLKLLFIKFNSKTFGN